MLNKINCRSSGQYSLLHTFSFTSYYPYGVGSVLYHPQHRIIIVAAVSSGECTNNVSAPAMFILTFCLFAGSY